MRFIVSKLAAPQTFAALALLTFASSAYAQTDVPNPPRDTDRQSPDVSMIEAKREELACTGMIEYAPAARSLTIVGGEEEQEQTQFSQGDVVFLSGGRNLDLRAGEMLSVARPRGQFKSDLSNKKGFLGVYFQEVGQLRITKVLDRTSVAVVTSACDTIYFGDYLRSLPNRVSPAAQPERPLDRFTESTGKQTGRIVLARDGREFVARGQVVFIDLGDEDNVKAGDKLTVFREVGKGKITGFRDDEVVNSASSGFESDKFKGGRFSNQAKRVKRPNETGIYGPTVTRPGIESSRPRLPRKVVGELIIISTERRTAAAILTRAAQEVNTGDYVELQ